MPLEFVEAVFGTLPPSCPGGVGNVLDWDRNALERASIADEGNRHTALRSPPVPMTDENERTTEHHLREAIRDLSEARDGELRKTNATVIEDVSDTVSTVLREQERDE